jgi:glycosyltransferase involved in cell wall biosynthesis
LSPDEPLEAPSACAKKIASASDLEPKSIHQWQRKILVAMKVLLCHNHYQHPGGEDRVFWDEGTLLESRGHTVTRFTMHNDVIAQIGRLDLARKTLWNTDAANQLRSLIQQQQPDVMHCTNLFPLISPAAYYVARKMRVAVVQSLHNYRMICPKAQFMRDGRVCEKCLGKSIAWPAIRHACYRESRSATATIVAMLAYHRRKKTWTTMVDRYITPTQFVKDKYVEGGFPTEKIEVKPNFVFPDPGAGSGDGQYFVFAGRLSPEKGLDTLLDAWSQLPPDVHLRIVGDGPMASRVQRAADSDSRIRWLGRVNATEVLTILDQARCLIMPSVCYETFGLTIAEAFAKGTPVIVSNLGAMAELVDDGRTGLLFEPNDSADLARKVQQLLADSTTPFRAQARSEFELNYSADRNYDRLVEIYDRAVSPQPAPQFSTAG